eukprot:TRINITY_DN453_c0_g3_i2.p1 TRINITY_DN453_c0_g3~~TRINITY_DN453_c0_g3_i2.p1  ORF type:complete len:352 (-),score=69.08 TRINITY_DN453_c0_g3_i2:31-1020(-)
MNLTATDQQQIQSSRVAPLRVICANIVALNPGIHFFRLHQVPRELRDDLFQANRRLLSFVEEPYFSLESVEDLKVKKLNLSNLDFLIPTHLPSLCRRFPNLTSIDLSYCYNLNNDALKILAAELTSLNSLSLSFSNFFNDESCAVLSSSFSSQLKQLYVSGNSFTDKGLEKICKSLKLEVLDVSRCRSLSSNGLKFISNLSSLTSLDASSTDLCSSESNLQKLMKGCGKLTELSIAETKISTKILKKLIQHMEGLQSLNIGFCTLNDSILEAVIKSIPTLKRLNLSGCSGMSDGALAKFLQHLNETELEELDLSWCSDCLLYTSPSPRD